MPVIVVTVVDERGIGLALGAVDYLVKPIDPEALLARLGRYTVAEMARTPSTRVLAIDDDLLSLEIVARTLEPLGVVVRQTTSGLEGIELAIAERPTW